MINPPLPPDEEQRLQALRQQARVFENIYDSVIFTDLTGRIIDCNPATEKMFGYTREELIGQPPRIWHSPEEATELTAKMLDGVRQNGRWSGEINFIRKDGAKGVCEVVVVPVYDEGGRHVVTVGVSHDITRQKREEQELKQRAAQLALINDIGSQIAAVLQLDEVLNQAAQLVQQTFGYHHVALFLVDEDVVRLKAIAGSYRAYFPPNHCQKLSQGIIGWVATHGRKMVANDVSVEPRYISLIADRTTTQAELCLPIKVADQTVGVLDIQSPRLNTFSDNDIMAMETLTNQIAVAIENARLYQTVQQSTSALQAIFRALPDLFLRLDAQGLILDCQAGPAFELHLPAAALVKHHLHEVFPPDIAQQIKQAVTHALETISLVTTEYSLPLPQGEQNFEARLLPISNHQVIAIVRDITKRKQAEETLRESEERFRSLFEHMLEGYAYCKMLFGHDEPQDFIYIAVNNAFEVLTGLKNVVGKKVSEVIPGIQESSPELFETYGRVALTGNPERFETYLESLGIWFSIAVYSPRREYFIAVFDNITERKRTELLERDRNQVLEMVSQNKPLKVILAALIQLVERQYPELLGSILLLQDGYVYHGAAPSLPESFTRMVDGLTLSSILKTSAMTAYKGETLIVTNIAAKSDQAGFRQLALKHDLQAYWLAPIFSSDGALLGLFISYYRQPIRPTPEERQLVKMASRLAAMAVEHHQLTEQLAYQAQHDALTGLPNRPFLEDHLQQVIAHARRNGHLVGLIYVDLDHFKLVNDTLGHAAGDALLRQMAQRLQDCIREEDIVARIGGDEFLVVLNELKEPQQVVPVAERILETLKQAVVVSGQELFITTSLGISFYPFDGGHSEELLRKADQALYLSKQQGKNTYQFYTSAINPVAREQLKLKYQLQGAAERGELLLYYQPQFKVSGGELVGLEALLRWNHPELGLIPPAKFIPLAEESGLIVPLGAWVLAEACRQNRAWQQAGYPKLRVAVNVSVLQFARTDFVEMVVQALAEAGLEPRWLQLELTESFLMRNPQEAASKLAQLRTLGVVIAIDDFGTGYSSLTYLRQLPIDTLKIAQPFVREIGVNLHNTPSDEAIITAITNLAHDLGMCVVAEGVETEQQLEFLHRVGCDEMQGFLFSRPLPPPQVEELLRSTLVD